MAYKSKNSENKSRWRQEFLNRIVHGDCVTLLKSFPANSIDIILTDPPYFLDKMDDAWSDARVSSEKYHHTVKSLPAGMKFEPEKGRQFYRWYLKVARAFRRVLKPGGFFFSFSAPRLYHRMASAVDDAGFHVRDCFIWVYTQNQAKAMSLHHFIDKMNLDESARKKLKSQFQDWKTPQLKSCFEPIIFAQKPYDKTFLNNILKHHVGLVNSKVKIGRNMFPANLLTVEAIEEALDKYFLIAKPSRREKGNFNRHKTVKPLTLCEHLLKLTAYAEDTIVLDPFIGSGTTAVAAKRLGLNYIGIDSNLEYVTTARRRLAEM